ncbi:hypothetical protein XELAEV_18012923mg [Xenopus laevis]|uniref:Uncharacterized protein n=1 Tax=Xenopus laevis TaxID=8355 RepID=A0A974HYW0_XENLA|nr:hypothetical protein XELAEV_18012923mg [Xenopus laevis]
MADQGWDGWPDPEAREGHITFSFRPSVPAPSPNRYVWRGTFGEDFLSPGCTIMVPYCGECGAECGAAFKRLTPSCKMCGRSCWMGPFLKMEESSGPIILAPPFPAVLPASPFSAILPVSPFPVPDVAAATSSKAEVTAGTATIQPMGATISSISSPSISAEPKGEELKEVTDPMGGLKVEPSTKKTATSGRGRGRAPPKVFGEKPPATLTGVVTSASCSSEGNSFESLHSSPDPDWGEMDFGPLPSSSASSKEELVTFFEKPMSPAGDPATDTSFWVCPGRADPQKQRTVSRIQRIINIRVFDQWGYYMPYAPEFVYDEVEKHLDEWVYGELIRREKIGSGGLFQKNASKGERDFSFLSNVVHEWWYGRTVLKHFVKSCGKFQEDKHFSLMERVSNGGRVEKPHPNYYLSYKDTVAKSCLGREHHQPSPRGV